MKIHLLSLVRYSFVATATVAVAVFIVTLSILRQSLRAALPAAETVGALQSERAVHLADAKRFEELTAFLKAKREHVSPDWQGLRDPFTGAPEEP